MVIRLAWLVSGACTGTTWTEICTDAYSAVHPDGYWLLIWKGDGIHSVSRSGTVSYDGIGTVTDSTAGRNIIHVTAGTNGEFHWCITAEDVDSTGNYIHQFALINCGSAAGVGTCANGNEAVWNADNYALDPAWVTAFGSTHQGGPGFTSYFRTMQSTKTICSNSFG